MKQFERDHQSIEKLIGYMKDNCQKPFNIHEHANVIYFSTSKLNKVFKEHLGIGPGSYFRKLRIQKAIEIQLRTGLSWTEISEIVGYADLASFSKSFKRVTGLNPKKMGLQHRMNYV